MLKTKRTFVKSTLTQGAIPAALLTLICVGGGASSANADDGWTDLLASEDLKKHWVTTANWQLDNQADDDRGVDPSGSSSVGCAPASAYATRYSNIMTLRGERLVAINSRRHV